MAEVYFLFQDKRSIFDKYELVTISRKLLGKFLDSRIPLRAVTKNRFIFRAMPLELY
jgi:hypothetical protein